jgi:hypothetical protein
MVDEVVTATLAIISSMQAVVIPGRWLSTVRISVAGIPPELHCTNCTLHRLHCS